MREGKNSLSKFPHIAVIMPEMMAEISQLFQNWHRGHVPCCNKSMHLIAGPFSLPFRTLWICLLYFALPPLTQNWRFYFWSYLLFYESFGDLDFGHSNEKKLPLFLVTYIVEKLLTSLKRCNKKRKKHFCQWCPDIHQSRLINLAPRADSGHCAFLEENI